MMNDVFDTEIPKYKYTKYILIWNGLPTLELNFDPNYIKGCVTTQKISQKVCDNIRSIKNTPKLQKSYLSNTKNGMSHSKWPNKI